LSSILKALQKLESETPEKGAGQSWLHNFNARQKSAGKQGRVRGKYRLALLCIGLIISGSATFMFISSRPPEIAITNEDDAPIRETALDGVNEGGASEPTSAGRPIASRDTKKSKNASSEKSSGQAARMVKDVSSAGPKKIEPFPEPLETSGTSMQPSAMESPHTTLNQENNLLNNEIETTDEPADSIFAKKIHNPGIKLHAISWTPDVKTRIAVINGSIVREGDTISSYRVFKINKDDIVLRKNGELWRLAFRGQ
jgi:hypothetical protein